MSSRMSESGLVIIRLVNPPPASIVPVCTRLAPTISSVALVVVANPLLLIAPLPCAAATTSKGLLMSSPAYSAIRISGSCAPAPVKVTVTELALAAAATMFLA